jgi:peptidoglycan/xylan/chitin deacetylase (PgdA/CDA1 family)
MYRNSTLKKQSVQAIQRMLKRFSSTGAILMYHRVAEEHIDPWGLCVSPTHFAQQLEVLRKHCHPLSLKEMVQRYRTGLMPRRAVAVTFDDGYADNLYVAKPLLERFEIPATVFVITGYCERNSEFWWDELERILLQIGTLPAVLCLTLNGTVHEWTLNRAVTYSPDDYSKDYRRHPWEAEQGTRLGFFYEVWKALRPLPAQRQEQALEEIRRWAGTASCPRHTHRQLSPAELMTMEEGGLVTTGAHTVNHPLLYAQALSVQEREIVQSKAYLENVLSHPVEEFSYPFGEYSPETVPVVRSAGFASACGRTEETVWRYSDSYKLPRFGVQDWSGEEFGRKVRQWFRN